MRVSELFKLLVVLGLAAVWRPLAAEPALQSSEESSAQKFVQDFYDWYIPGADKRPSAELAIKMKPLWFSKAIIQGIKDERASKDKSPGYDVGNDFDPFFEDGEHPCGPYKAGKVTTTKDSYHVELFGTCGSSDPNQPDVIAAVTRQDGNWVFVDFIYTETDDLFAELKTMKELREDMKIPPRVTGGYSFKIYVIPREETEEVLAEEGVLYISSTPFTDAQMAEAKQQYGDHIADSFATENHITNLCFAMNKLGSPLSPMPGREVFLNWMGSNNSGGHIRIYSWSDWWEWLSIKKVDGKVSMTEHGGDRGWGWKQSRVEATADLSVNYESCLNYLKMHPRTGAPAAGTR